jgi:lipoprotein-anchoring transpeptidase ErfK/SrfK
MRESETSMMKMLMTIPTAIAGSFMPILSAFPAQDAQITPQVVNDAQLTGTISEKATCAVVLRAQVLLDRAHFAPGEIDAVFGAKQRIAVKGFQKAHNLESTGSIDERTWAVLNGDVAPMLATYKITAADVAGPFTTVPSNMMDKAKMSALGYASPAEALGEKFHVGPALLQQLNPGKNFSHAGEEVVVPNVDPPTPLEKGAKVVVDKSNATVSLVDAAGKTVAQFPASMGSVHDPLPLGRWKINGVAKNPKFHYNSDLFWDADSSQPRVAIPAGPNNPVGVVWIDLSKTHYGIHGTPEPRNIGKTESHGCIRLSNWDASLLSQAVRPGMLAVLQK